MPSPSADDHSPVTRSSAGGAPRSRSLGNAQSRTGKFLQVFFGRTAPPVVVSAVNNQPMREPPSELIQVVAEPNTWDEGDDSNWDDDFMYEPKAPMSKPDIPEALEATVVAAPSVSDVITQPAVATPLAVVDELGSPTAAEGQPISVNIPRPKNIKYKNKDPQAIPTATASTGDKAEAIEFKVKRPATIKYKVKPLEQPSWLEKILAPGRNLWGKVANWGDIIPNQLTENPKKILGILAAVLLSIVTSWAVVRFWPHPATAVVEPSAITSAAIAQTSPEETLITAVRSQFSTLASQYPAGLISNLELDNERQLAIVTLGNLWGSLSGEQQQQVAQSLWQQSRAYQMAKLEVRSGTGNVLARSPVVGQDMVILASW
jgi:hypothetical protein